MNTSDPAAAASSEPPTKVVGTPKPTQASPTAPATVSVEPTSPHRHWRWVAFAAVLGGLIAGGALAIPIAITALNTISTDDAYVNGHSTFVAPRVSGQVKKVLVDDNWRVKKGEPVVLIDPEPFQAVVDVKQALVIAAEADLLATESQVRGLWAQARSLRWKLEVAIENVDNQVAQLNAKIATLGSKEATLERTKADLDRVKDAYDKKVSSKQDYDLAIENHKVAKAQVNEVLQGVYETRVGLGLPARPANGDLAQVPENWNQRFSSVRQALAALAQIIAQLGLPLTKSEATPQSVLDEFRKKDESGDIDLIIQKYIPQAPAIKQAQAKLLQARRDLARAELNVKYCTVEAEIDGVVTRRNVNKGNNVQIAQQLMVIRSLTEIWIDANFKETQLDDLKIGQRVEVVSDTYGSRQKFKGRITGFTYGTGSTLALLPAQNATGNFVKVVQRLPVRIELEDYDPETDTLFAGLSITPYVYYKKPPHGPNAGQRLQDLSRTPAPGGPKP